jgi:hypothetical protein
VAVVLVLELELTRPHDLPAGVGREPDIAAHRVAAAVAGERGLPRGPGVVDLVVGAREPADVPPRVQRGLGGHLDRSDLDLGHER